MSVVAISRQVGSMGDNIARLVSSELKMELITRGRIHDFVTECDPEFAKACAMYEEEAPKSFWSLLFFDTAKHAALFEWLTLKLASKGNVVLLGRGTPVVLRDRPDVFRVRIVAPLEIRIQRVKASQKCSLKEAEHFVSSYGSHRRKMIESIFKVNLSDPELYDLQINTAELTVEAAAKVLITGIKAKMKTVDSQKSQDELIRATRVKQVSLAIKKELDPGFWQQIEAHDGGEGQIIITGYVYESHLRDLAEKTALKIAGVQKVDNRLMVVRRT